MSEPPDLYLERSDPKRNMARFYGLSMEIDLFGTIVAVRRWGRIGTRGRSRSTVCGSVGDASMTIEAMAQAKRRRGYCERAGETPASPRGRGAESS